MEANTKIIVTLPNEDPFEATYLKETTNTNLIKIRIDDGKHPRYGFVNKKCIQLVR